MQTGAERLREITQIDRELWEKGVAFAGIDEAGRGPLAGPVAAGCAVMPEEPLIPGVDDSKKLSEKKREALYEQILKTAVFANVGWASVDEIERLNILGATKLAMARAAQGAPCALFLIDAVTHVDVPGEQKAIVKGDSLCYSIAAASILAKVARDRLMRELDAEYPQYGFAAHKGYGTRAHIEAILAHGACPAHRRDFIRNFLPQSRRAEGDRGEALACEYLLSRGYAILRRNYAIRGAEVDIIAKEGETIVFVEVKTRSSTRFAAPREAVTPAKRQRIILAATRFLAEYDLCEANIRFDVIEVIGSGVTHLRAAFDGGGG